MLSLRQITRRKPGRGGDGRQVHILTTRPAADLPAAGVVYRMTSRWREENYFRYARAHFALDALDSYTAVPDDPGRLVPNPAKKTAAAAVKAAKKAVAQAEAARQEKLAALRSPAPGISTVITNQMLARLERPVEAARRELGATQAAAKATPAKIPLSQHSPGQVRLETETKLITHAIRMAACNAETILARALHGHYARAADEAFALIREALTASGDIIPGDGVLHVRLDPLTAPRRTRALTALCHQLNTTQTRYPRHHAHPALRSQRTPWHCINDLPMSGALGLSDIVQCIRSWRVPTQNHSLSRYPRSLVTVTVAGQKGLSDSAVIWHRAI